jgi:tetratricopeptide (TPR) repeat protein/tRNA A-37 threonylcarbamoyl transferase component Bud32
VERDVIRPGEELNGLVVLSELGRGPHGAIYLARDPLIGRHVTLKTIPIPDAGSSEAGERLLSLLRRVGGLSHPNISHLHRVHPYPGCAGWILELEYLEGTMLRERFESGDPFTITEIFGVARAILSALAAAHRRGIVHGQLDEEKVILGKGGLVKLVDFGIAAALAGRESAGNDLQAVSRLLRGMVDRAAAERDDPLLGELENLAIRWLESNDDADPARALEEFERLGRQRGGEESEPGSLAVRGSGLVGRAAELERIEAALVEAMRGRAGGLLIEGKPGMGRTSLLAEARRMAAAAGATHLDLEGDRVASALFEAARHAGLRVSPGPDGTPTSSDCAPLVRALLNQPERVRESAPYTTYRACEGLLAELSARQPLLVTLDGLERVPADDARMLAEILGKRAGSRLLIAVGVAGEARSPGTAEFASAPNVARIELRPLAAGAVHRLLEERTGGHTPASELVQHLVEVCEGNPRLTLELFDHLERSGAIERDAGILRVTRPWDEIAPPSGSAGQFRAALDGLQDEQRLVLRAAAVDGVDFDGQAVAAALDRPTIAVLRALQTIWRKGGLLRIRDEGYRFEHGLLREWIYRSLPVEERAALHRAIAVHLVHRSGTEPPDPERLARHWEAAGEPERAKPHFLRAAETADYRRNPHRVLDLARRAGWNPGGIPSDEALAHADLILDLARAYLAKGEPALATKLHRDLDRAAEAKGDEPLRRRVKLDRARLLCETEGPAAIDEQELLEVRNAEPDGALRAAACHLLGRAAKHAGRFDDAERWLDEASRMQEDAGERSSLALSLDQLASVAARDGRLRDACRLYRRGAELCRDAGLDAEAALHELNEMRCAFDAGIAGDVSAAFEKCLRQLSLSGQRHRHAQVSVALADHLLDRGDRETAIALLDRSLPMLEASGHLPGLVPAHRLLGRLALCDGDLDQAGDHIATAIQLAARAGDVAAGAEAQALEAQRLCLLGRAEEAGADAETALRRADEAGDRRARARVIESLAEALFLGLPQVAALESRAWTPGEIGAATLLKGALAWSSDSGAIHDLREGAEIRDPVGRSLPRLLGAWMAAEAERRSGDPQRARRHAERAHREAVRIRHVWLEADLQRYLDELE